MKKSVSNFIAGSKLQRRMLEQTGRATKLRKGIADSLRSARKGVDTEWRQRIFREYHSDLQRMPARG